MEIVPPNEAVHDRFKFQLGRKDGGLQPLVRDCAIFEIPCGPSDTAGLHAFSDAWRGALSEGEFRTASADVYGEHRLS